MLFNEVVINEVYSYPNVKCIVLLHNVVLITDEQDFIVMTDSPLILSTEYQNATISIYIFDDNLIEHMEFFSISLYFVGGLLPRMTLNPSTATVVILDDDGRC